MLSTALQQQQQHRLSSCTAPHRLPLLRSPCLVRRTGARAAPRRANCTASAEGGQQLQQPQQPEQPQQPGEQPPIQVSVNSSIPGIARAVMHRLQHSGGAEVWATSAANHHTAVAALARAHAQLLEAPLLMEPRAAGAGSSSSPGGASVQQQQQQPPWGDGAWCHGLAAAATLTSHDQPTKDSQKRRLLKLTLAVAPAPELDAALLRPGQPGALSANRIKGVPDLLAGLRERLLAQPGGGGSEGGDSSVPRAGAVCVVEARGEQAVTRTIKAAMSLQAAVGRPLLLRPVAAKVVDVVAEKRGQTLLADGSLLLLSWGAQE